VILAACAVAAIALFRPASPSPATPSVAWSTPPPPRASHAPASAVVVYVAGAVRHPGIYRLRGDARVDDAVARAGGLRPDADPLAVNLAARLRDGEEIAVRVRGAAATPPPPRAAISRRSRRGSSRRAQRSPPAEAIDLNAADTATLASLPGVGPALASRIVAFRELNGPFASADELLDVAGITERRYAEMAPYVVVH
jgi:competence protein ComEA